MSISPLLDGNAGDLTDVPTKCMMSNKTLEILANVVFIDFEGRSDGESVKRIISQMRPRQLILVHGTVEATKSLADYCRLARSHGEGRRVGGIAQTVVAREMSRDYPLTTSKSLQLLTSRTVVGGIGHTHMHGYGA